MFFIVAQDVGRTAALADGILRADGCAAYAYEKAVAGKDGPTLAVCRERISSAVRASNLRFLLFEFGIVGGTVRARPRRECT